LFLALLSGKLWSHKATITLATTLLLSSCSLTPASADVLKATQYFTVANKYMNQGDYKTAAKTFEQSIAEYNVPGFEKFKSLAVNGLGIAHWRMGLYPQAEKLFRQSLELTRMSGGANTTEYGATLNNLALMLQLQSQYIEAETLFKQAQSIYKSKGDANEAYCLSNLAGLYQDQGLYSKAEDLYNQALTMTVASGDEEQVATTLNDMGTLYRDQDMYEEAERYFKRALAKIEKLSGNQSSTYAIIAGNLAKTYARQGRYDEATPLQLASLKTKERTLGADHPMVATGLVSLAEIDLDQGRLKEAHDKLENALTIRQAKLGQSPDTAEVIDLLGQVAMKQNDAKQAQIYFKQALTIREDSLGTGNALTGKSKMLLGEALVTQKLYPEAESLYKQAIDVNSRTFGRESARVALDYDKLATLYSKMGKQAEADKAADTALQIKRKLPGGARLKRTQPVATGTTQTANPPTTKPTAIAPATLPAVPLTGTTKPATIATTTTPTSTAPGDKWALVVGISNYQDTTLNLKYSAKDARDFYDYLLQDGHFKSDHAKLLVDSDASRENIMSLLGDSWLPKTVKPNDLVVLYVSSHGSPSEMDVKGENYLVVFDTKKDKLYATGISMQELIDKIKRRINTDRVLIVLDACHSGATRDGAKGLYKAQNFDSETITQGSGQMVICSSSPDQASWESKNYPNGVFTRQLIEALKQQKSIAQAYNQLKDKVQDEVLRDRGQVQTPELKNAWKGGDLQLAQ
jgi:tetratricopeptide (TPR) repeat protein